MFELELENLKKETAELSESLHRDFIDHRNVTIHYFDLYTRAEQLEVCSLPKLFIRSSLVAGVLFVTLVSVGMTISKTSPYEATSLIQIGSKLLFGIGGVSTTYLGIRNWQKQQSLLGEFDDMDQFRKELHTSYADFLESGRNVVFRSVHYGTIIRKKQYFQVLASIAREEEESFSVTHFHLRENRLPEKQVLKKDARQVFLSPFVFFNEEEADSVSVKETGNQKKVLVFSSKSLYTNNSKFWKRNSNKS